jgi:2-hydroxy-6-oxonona-2,4-dienedioate hydrolase
MLISTNEEVSPREEVADARPKKQSLKQYVLENLGKREGTAVVDRDTYEVLASHRRRRLTKILNVVALAVALLFMLVGSHTSGAVSPNGEVADLKAKFVDVKGVRTRYYEMGQGEPLVLFGSGNWSPYSSANIWSKNIPGLAKRFHVLAPDPLGCGMTGNPLDDKDYNIEGIVEHMHQFIQTMKLGKVHVVGETRGGGDAFFFAVEHPDMVRTLVVVDSVSAAPEGSTGSRAANTAKCMKLPDFEEAKCTAQALSFNFEGAFDDEYWEAAKYMGSLPKAEETRAKIKAGVGGPLGYFVPIAIVGAPQLTGFNAFRKMWIERVRNEGILQMPVLLYWGFNDPSALVARGLELFDVIGAKNPKTQMIIINKAGHMNAREKPEEFNYNVTNFIDYWER